MEKGIIIIIKKTNDWRWWMTTSTLAMKYAVRGPHPLTWTSSTNAASSNERHAVSGAPNSISKSEQKYNRNVEAIFSAVQRNKSKRRVKKSFAWEKIRITREVLTRKIENSKVIKKNESLTSGSVKKATKNCKEFRPNCKLKRLNAEWLAQRFLFRAGCCFSLLFITCLFFNLRLIAVVD